MGVSGKCALRTLARKAGSTENSAPAPSMLRSDPHHIANHRTRFLACLAAALALLAGAVRFWPVERAAPEPDATWRTGEQERIPIEEIQPTRHAASPPAAPPAPLTPVLVPEDEYLAEEELDFSDSALSLEPSETPATDIRPPVAPAGVTAGPRIVRVATPEYTEEARRKRVRAKLVVQVRVNARGRVAEAAVTERFLLDEDGQVRESVDILGYGLEEAAIAAANQYMYRPARKNGQAIESRTTITSMLGVDR